MLSRTYAAGAPLAIILLLLGSSRAPGEEPAAKWLGVATPEETRAARLQHKSPPYYDLGLGPLPLTGPGKDDYPDIRGAQLHAWVKDFVGFAVESRREGAILWGRLAGTKAQHQTAAYVRKKFEEFGLRDIHTDEFVRNAQWWPTKSRLSVLLSGAAGKPAEYVFQSAFPAHASPAAPSGVVEAEVVDVGLGRAVDLAGRDVRGKIAVLHAFPQLGLLPIRFTGYGVQPELAKMGAAGVITVLELPENAQALAFQTNAQTAPAFTLGSDDGRFLEDLIARAKPSSRLRIRMELEVEIKEGWKTENVYGLAPGTTGEYAIVSAHQDAWFGGAADNASGLATMLALARHYGADRNHRRNLLFVATAGHHMGNALMGSRMNTGPGSPGTHYMIEHYPEILKQTVLAVNCEHTASIARQTGGQYRTPEGDFEESINTENARVFAVSNRSPRLLELARAAIDRYGITVAMHTDHIPHGDAAELGTLVPTVSMVEANTWYHTTADMPDIVPPAGLERSARAFAWLVDQVDRVSRAELERGAAMLGNSKDLK